MTDVEDMYRRLSVISRQLEELGLTHEKNYGVLLAASENTGPNDGFLLTAVSSSAI
ncbi:MAG: hypothetical protein M3R69_08060 [Acidobacteriota bacterium]|nr:hypothetical protein [Acidobacteriota bacterium]